MSANCVGKDAICCSGDWADGEDAWSVKVEDRGQTPDHVQVVILVQVDSPTSPLIDKMAFKPCE